MSWTEKHRPSCFVDIKGQDEAILKIKEFIDNFPNTKRKAIVLHGPPGVGKTTLAHVAAQETQSEIFELNASDFRNKNQLQEKLKPAIEQRSLTNKGKIILVDEADGISGFYDRGGVPELIRLVENSHYPVIITANDIWSKKLSALRKKAELIELREVEYNTIKEVLACVLEKEKKFIHPKVLTEIAIKAKGDLRAAINDIQTTSQLPNSEKVELSERNKKTDIFNSLKQVFKAKPTNEILNVYDSVNMGLDEIILWVEENIPAEYKGEALAKAIIAVANADRFKGRIYRKQYWRFLVYENIFLSYGVSASKKEIKEDFTSYKKPTRILKIWLNNQRTMKKKSIAIKYAKQTHISQKQSMKDFPITKQIIKSNPNIQHELKLSEDEISYLQTH